MVKYRKNTVEANWFSLPTLHTLLSVQPAVLGRWHYNSEGKEENRLWFSVGYSAAQPFKTIGSGVK